MPIIYRLESFIDEKETLFRFHSDIPSVLKALELHVPDDLNRPISELERVKIHFSVRCAVQPYIEEWAKEKGIGMGKKSDTFGT